MSDAKKLSDKERAAAKAIRNVSPTPQQQARIAEARMRVKARPARFETRIKSEGGEVTYISPPHNDRSGHREHEKDAFGTNSPAFASRMYAELATISGFEKGIVNENALNAALAVVDGARPNSELEAQLLVQMAGTHRVAMDVLTRSKFASNAEGMQLYGNLAMKLLRTYTAQMETLAKIRRGPQVVEVRHVHVYPGGQAIVGDVHQHPEGGGGGGDKNGRQPHELSLSHASAATMRGAEPSGETMPVTSNEGKAAVSTARRSTRQRGS